MNPDQLFPQIVISSTDALPAGFVPFLDALVRTHGAAWAALVREREADLRRAAIGVLPAPHPAPPHPLPGERITLPSWAACQTVQLTFPASRAKMGVGGWNCRPNALMFDLEDANMDTEAALLGGIANARAAMRGELTCVGKAGETVGMEPHGDTVITTRIRGLHMTQRIAGREGAVPASLFDIGLLLYGLDWPRLPHPPVIYVPKMQTAAEAAWYREVLRDVAVACGQEPTAIKCMILVERLPLIFELPQVIRELRDHLLAINLGKWDYVASLGMYTGHDRSMLLPDRTSIPYDAPFLERAVQHAVNVGHDWGVLVIYGMTALFPNKEDPALDAQAMRLLHDDSAYGARMKCDAKWAGHLRQLDAIRAAYPQPNQLQERWGDLDPFTDLLPPMAGVGTVSLRGTLEAVRASIEYREGVLRDDAAALVRGYMLDLAMDLIDRVILWQRCLHRVEVDDGSGGTFVHTKESVAGLYARVVDELIAEAPADAARAERIRHASRISYAMVLHDVFEPN